MDDVIACLIWIRSVRVRWSNSRLIPVQDIWVSVCVSFGPLYHYESCSCRTVTHDPNTAVWITYSNWIDSEWTAQHRCTKKDSLISSPLEKGTVEHFIQKKKKIQGFEQDIRDDIIRHSLTRHFFFFFFFSSSLVIWRN